METLVAKIEAAKAIMQEWFDSENWDESYDHEILCRLDIVLNNRKMAVASDLKIPRKETQIGITKADTYEDVIGGKSLKGGSVIKSLQKEEPSAELIQRYRSEYAEQGNEENTTP